MSVTEKHPTMTAARLYDWRLCRDAYEGEGDVKLRGEIYLPMPSGYRNQTDGGVAAYTAYKVRAQFPEIMAPSVGAMVGIIHDKEIQIDLPDSLSYLFENADNERKTLLDFHREITRQLLVTGRYGVLADAPIGGGDPYLAGYLADDIINWDKDFYVVDETDDVRDGFSWTLKEKHRVLQLDGGFYTASMYDGGGSTDITPTGRGGARLTSIPFAVASAKDVGPCLETPPLIGVARSSLSIYQLSADYRLQLFMSGQETLAAINADAPDAVGAGVVVEIKGTEGLPADLKYVSPSCSGIKAHLEAIQHNREAAVQAGARLFEQSQQATESGAARKMRFRSETANLKSIAQASCSLLEKSLRNVAMLLGQSESVIESIIVTPPKDLLDATMTPQEAASLFELVQNGGLAFETYYERIQAGGIASDERTYDEEIVLIEDDLDRADGLTPQREALPQT